MQTTITPELEALVKRAITKYPAEQARIERGAALVATTTLRDDGSATVSSNYHLYHVAGGKCTCPDLYAPEGRCKHRWAACLAAKLRKAQNTLATVPALRELEFYASVGAENGVARVREDGAVWFMVHDGDGWVSVGWDEVVLGGRKDLVDAAWGNN